MKKIVVFTAVMLFGYMTALADNLKYGDTFKETILELEFSEGAKAEANDAFISWDLLGDWDKFSFQFSQGAADDGVYTIKASEYKDLVNQFNGIALTLNGKRSTRSGNYELSMKVKEVSKDMTFMADELDLVIPIDYIGIPLWKRLLVPFIILVVLVLLAILVLHLTAKFPRGLLQLGQDSVKLKGKKRISLKEELEKLDVTLAEGTDVILVKKRFGAFQGPCIKEMKKCDLERDGEYLTPGSIIHFEEEIKGLRDINGNDIIIIYV